MCGKEADGYHQLIADTLIGALRKQQRGDYYRSLGRCPFRELTPRSPRLYCSRAVDGCGSSEVYGLAAVLFRFSENTMAMARR